MRPAHPSAAHAARIPLPRLPALAGLRAAGHVTVVSADHHAWVRWSRDAASVVAALLSVPAVEWFVEEAGHWFRIGGHLPTPDVPPPGEAVPLDRVLLPAKFTPLPPGQAADGKVLCRLVASDVARPTTAMRCPLASLNEWVELATTAQLESVRACLCDDQALLIGDRLPWAENAERYWGRDVLIPIGFRPDPAWPEAALREAAGVTADEVLILGDGFTEAVPRPALEPLSRAAWRAVTKQS